MAKTPQARTITIVVHPTSVGPYATFDVFDGEGRYAHCLAWDEFLGAVADLTLPRTHGPWDRYSTSPDEQLERLHRRRLRQEASR